MKRKEKEKRKKKKREKERERLTDELYLKHMREMSFDFLIF